MAEPGVVPGVTTGAVLVAPFSCKRQMITELSPAQTAVIVSPFGPSSTLVQRYSAVQASDSEIRWQVVSPSSTVGLCREFYVSVDFNLTYTPDAIAAGNGGIAIGAEVRRLAPGVAAGPRQFPIHSVTSNIRMEINNAAISMSNVNQVIHALNAYSFGSSTEETALWAGMASKKDIDVEYADPAVGGAGGSAYPFASLGSSEASDTRSLYYYTTGPVVVDAAGVQRVTVRLVERVQGPLCLFGEKSGPALYNVDTFNLSLSFSNLRRLISGHWSALIGRGVALPPAGAAVPFQDNGAIGPDDATASRLVVSVDNNPASHSLWARFVQPPATVTISPQLIWKWSDVQTFSTSFAFPAAAIGTTASVTTVCQLSGVPSRALVFCAPDFSNSAAVQIFRPSHFTRLRNLSVTFDNRTGLLSNIDSDYLLYAGSRANGLTLSWLKAFYGLGLVHCFVFGGGSGNTIDIPQPGVSAGCNGTYSLRVQATAEKLDGAVTAYRMYVITVSDALLACSGQQYTPSVNPLSEQMILEAAVETSLPGARDIQRQAGYYGTSSEMVGGSFLSTLGDIWSGVKRFVGPTARAIGSIAPALSFVPGLNMVAPAVGSVASGVASALGSGRLSAAQKRKLLRGKGAVETAASLGARAKLLS